MEQLFCSGAHCILKPAPRTQYLFFDIGKYEGKGGIPSVIQAQEATNLSGCPSCQRATTGTFPVHLKVPIYGLW